MTLIDNEVYISDRWVKFSSEASVRVVRKQLRGDEKDNRNIVPYFAKVASSNGPSRTKCLYLPNLLGGATSVSHSEEECLGMHALISNIGGFRVRLLFVRAEENNSRIPYRASPWQMIIDWMSNCCSAAIPIDAH